MSSTQVSNPAVSFSDAAIDLATSFASKLLITSAQAAQPWLALPIISALFSWFVNRWMDKLDVQEKNLVAHIIIDNQTGAEASEVKKAREALFAAQNSGDPNAQIAASNDFDKAFGNLIHFNGG